MLFCLLSQRTTLSPHDRSVRSYSKLPKKTSNLDAHKKRKAYADALAEPEQATTLNTDPEARPSVLANRAWWNSAVPTAIHTPHVPHTTDSNAILH